MTTPEITIEIEDTLPEESLNCSPHQYEKAVKDISGGASASIEYPEDEALVKSYVAQRYFARFGGSENYEGNTPGQNQGEVYFGETLITALKGSASWKGYIMDLFGVVGADDSHHTVAESLHQGTLNDVATERAAVVFLVEIGVPLEEILQVLVNMKSDMLPENLSELLQQ